MGRLLILVGIILIVVAILPLFIKKKEKETKISEWSYKRFVAFYGVSALTDKEFYTKLDKILRAINVDKKTSLQEIADYSKCELEDCILKIRYLKNKRKIGDLIIDKANGVIKPCSPEEQMLIDKYKPFVFAEHLQIEEIARRGANADTNTLNQKVEEIKKDIKHLMELDLLNGIKYDEGTNILTYYSIEKHNKEKEYMTVECPKCGSLNDVSRTDKVKCTYCGETIEGKNFKVPSHVAVAQEGIPTSK